MKAEIKLLTPELAKQLLLKNTGNRKVKPVKNFYASQMRNGDWKENGEPIIIDTNGVIKDGQHRLYAVIESGHSFNVPIIYDVNPDVMDTIDTGTNRGLNDVLELNNFKYSSALAPLVKGIISYENGTATQSIGTKSTTMKQADKYISNKVGLEFALNNRTGLENLIKLCASIFDKQVVKVFSSKEIGVFTYAISGYFPTESHQEFIKKICGVILDENSATSWFYKKLLDAKSKQISISADWKMAAFSKVWNVYASGDYPVNHLKVKIGNVEKLIKL